jgi:hypothetical protein
LCCGEDARKLRGARVLANRTFRASIYPTQTRSRLCRNVAAHLVENCATLVHY